MVSNISITREMLLTRTSLALPRSSRRWFPHFRCAKPQVEMNERHILLLVPLLAAVIPLRVGSMHAAEREIFLLKQMAALTAMVDLALHFHPETARWHGTPRARAASAALGASDWRGVSARN